MAVRLRRGRPRRRRARGGAGSRRPPAGDGLPPHWCRRSGPAVRRRAVDDETTTAAGPPGRGRHRHRRETPGRRRVLRTVALLGLLLAWLTVSGIGGPLVGRLSEVQQNNQAGFLPADAESTRVAAESARFSGADTLPYFVLVERASGLTPADTAAVQRYVAALPGLRVPGATADGSAGGDRLARFLAPGRTVAVPSADGRAVLVPVAVRADE